MKVKVYVNNEETMVLKIDGKVILETPSIYGRQAVNMCVSRAKRYGVTIDPAVLMEGIKKNGRYEQG